MTADEKPDQRVRRRGTRWVQLGYGIQMPSGLDGRAAMTAELAAWLPLLPPSAVFTGLTAARMHGLWLPTYLNGLPHFVAMGSVRGEVKPDRHELVVSRHPSAPTRMDVDGLPVAPVPEALLACARILPLPDLLVLIDSALHLDRCTPAQIAAAAAPRRKGSPALRGALELADGRAESAWESMLRLLHHLIGVDVTPQANITDDRGSLVARGDLLLDGTRTLHEYDGGGHRDGPQHRRDLKRERKLLNAGCVRRGYTSDVLLRSPLAVLRDCEATLGRTLDHSGVQEWIRLLNLSLMTRAGHRVVLRRLGRG
jgi:hypothetical protein